MVPLHAHAQQLAGSEMILGVMMRSRSFAVCAHHQHNTSDMSACKEVSKYNLGLLHGLLRVRPFISTSFFLRVQDMNAIFSAFSLYTFSY